MFEVHFNAFVRWPRVANALQIKKTHANNKKNACKFRKQHAKNKNTCKHRSTQQIGKTTPKCFKDPLKSYWSLLLVNDGTSKSIELQPGSSLFWGSLGNNFRYFLNLFVLFVFAYVFLIYIALSSVGHRTVNWIELNYATFSSNFYPLLLLFFKFQ